MPYREAMRRIALRHAPAYMRPVPENSGEGAIYSPEYLTRKEGNANGAEPDNWSFHAR